MTPAFDAMTDEELVVLAQDGSTDAMDYLLEKYKNFVKAKVRNFYLVGADREDVVQEGMIGLYKSIRDYRGDRQASFHGFADMCIRRQIITAIKTATRQKHIPLNSAMSLNQSAYEGESERTLLETVARTDEASPETRTISEEDMASIQDKIDTLLTPLEREVMSKYLEGKSYQQISLETGRHGKCVDNALQRVKLKLRNSLLKDE